MIVECLGTENRRFGNEAVLASDCIYEFIIFNTANIKSLILEEGMKRDLTNEIVVPLRIVWQETKGNSVEKFNFQAV